MPDVTQGADQSALVKISDVIEPGFITVNVDTGQYVLRLPGDPKVDDLDLATKTASARFSEMLGVLRAKKHGRGELQVEVGRTHIRDEHGNQIVRVGTAKVYVSSPGEMQTFASKAATGLSTSAEFRNALRVFGRANRDAADFYLVYELAKKQFGGSQEIRDRLGLSKARLNEFRKSANHLSATDGGRHAIGDPSKATMNLDQMSRFTTELVAAWANTY